MAEIRRNSDVRSLTIDFSKESNPGEAFISAINKNSESFLTSDYDDYLLLKRVDVNSKALPKRHRWEKPDTWAITSQTLNKVIALQFAEFHAGSVPNDSTIAYGSKFYSNDEQKAFALKYDCTIAKSPSKTEYYFLNEEEELTINEIQNSHRKYVNTHSFNKLFLTPSVIKDAVEAYFDDSHTQMDIREKLIQARIWNKLLPNGSDNLLDFAGKPLRTNLNVIDAIAYAYKTAMLGKLGYQDSGLSTYTESHLNVNLPDLKYFKMTPTNYYYGLCATVNNKSYERPLVYEVELASADVEKYKNGEDITLTIPLSFVEDWRIIFERVASGSYYNQNTYIDIYQYIPGDAKVSITVNNKTSGLTALLLDETYKPDSINYRLVDRLVGFLSENPNIKLVTSDVFSAQLRNQSPTLNAATYDSLFGMICSEDDNTRKTAVKMLQGFDLPDRSQNDALSSYIRDLAVDLIANSNITGASVNKWLIKETDYNLNRQPSYVYRTNRSRYTSNIYDMGWTNGNIMPFEFGDRCHPRMTYQERDLAFGKYDDLGKLLFEYFSPLYKECKKHYNHRSMSPPYFSPAATYIINKRQAELASESPNSVIIAQCDLYIRHYVNYLLNKVFLGLQALIRYEHEFNHPDDLKAFVPDSRMVERVFGPYKALLQKAKTNAIKNPVAFMNLIKDSFTQYETVNSLSHSTWDRDREFNFILQLLHTKGTCPRWNSRNPINVTFDDVKKSLELISQLTDPVVTENSVTA